MASLKVLQQHLRQLKACNQCPEMIRPVVVGSPALSKVMLIGQAPGVKEGQFGRPFTWTADKTMFKWFASGSLALAPHVSWEGAVREGLKID